jgi:hypothetical protein
MLRATILLLLLLVLPGAAMATGIDFTVTPGGIEIDALYNGTTITVEGQVPDGSQVVLRFTGKPGEVHMKQKGKVMGLLWMNMNALTFDHVPAVCLVESTAELAGMGAVGAKLGLEGVSDNFVIEPATADRAMLMPEFLKLKRNEGLYREAAGAVKLGEAEGGLRTFSAQVDIPSRLSPGTYAMEVFAVKDGQVAAQGVKSVNARMIGIPSMLADLAFNHGAWYGVLASIIAILSGLAIGLVFQSKGAH